MSTFKTEAEQVDDLKRWVKSYGPSIVIGILIALVIIYGREFWQKHKLQKAEQASVLYQTVSDAYNDKNIDLANKTTEQLKNDFSSSPYTQYAVFLQAKTAVGKQNYTEASDDLNWVMTNSSDKNLQSIARLRLAQVQLADNKPEVAMTTLAPLKETAYKGLADVVNGDALLSMNKPQEAKKAYQAALSNIPNATDVMPTLQMRIDNIGE